MAYSYNVYTGNGSTTQFTIGFSYIRREHVKVYVNYVDTAYTYVNNTTVQLATAPGAGVRVEVRRITPFANVLVDFTDGSTLVAADLDTSNLQHLYLEQELDDANKQAIYVDPASGQLTAGGQQIKNVADPTAAQDAATKAYVDTADALRLKRDGTQAMTGALPMGGFKVTGAADPTSAQDLATKTYVDTTTVASAGDTMTGPLAMGTNKITGLGTPSANADAATKAYVDTVALAALPDGDRGDITVSGVGTVWTIDNGAVVEAKIGTGAVTSAKILDGTIVDADVNASAGIVASKLAFTQSGTGAMARTVDSKLKETASVKDFGAVGDGVANDTAAIQAALNARNVIYVPNGTYLCGALTFNSQNVLKGESRSGSVLTYTGSTTFITGGSDLSRVGWKNLTITASSNPSGYAIFFDSSTVRQPRIVNVAIAGFTSGIRIDDAVNGWVEQVYLEGRGAGVAGGVGLQFGESPVQAGTTWQTNNVYVNSFQTAVKTWSTASMFNTLIIENCTTGFYSSAPATVIAPWFEMVTTEFDLYLNGICIIAPRWANVNPQVNVDSTVTYARTTIIPCSGDTSPIYDPSWKLGYLNIWRTGEIQQDLLQNQPTPTFNFSINPSANYSHGIERKTTAGTGYNYELKAGGAKSGTTNTDGGNLYLSSGLSTGSGGSDVYIATPTPGSSGTSDISQTNKWVFYRDGRFFPAADGLYDIGIPANRTKRVHAKEGYVVTTPNGASNYLIAVDNAGNLTTTLV